MPDRPLFTMLTAGIIAFFASAGVSFLWATLEPESSTSEPSETKPVNEETEVNFKKINLTDWEQFGNYEGERVLMLAIEAGQTVNIRSGPDDGTNVIQQQTGRALFEQLGEWDNWYLIRTRQSKIGWIHNSIVRQLNVPQPIYKRYTKELPKPAKIFKNQLPKRFDEQNLIKVTVKEGNFRTGPGTQYPLVQKVFKHQRLRLLAAQYGWFRVETPAGITGWIHRDLGKPVWYYKPDSWADIQLKPKTELRIGPNANYRADPIPKDQLSGMIIAIVEGDEHWFQVELPNDRIGWVPQSASASTPD